MSRLSNILPNEKDKEENELITKYKEYKMDYLVHVRDKAEKENNSLKSCGYTLMFGAIAIMVFVFIYVFCYLVPKIERIRAAMPLTNTSLSTAIDVGVDIAQIDMVVIGVVIMAFVGWMISLYGCCKYGRACEFYDKVIDAKMEDEKLL